MTSSISEVRLNNPNLNVDNDKLFHLGFSTNSKEFKETFSDVQFVCLGGSAHRMLVSAQMCCQILKEIPGFEAPKQLINLCSTDRYVCYKVGPVLFINHGIGISSAMVVLHEVIKALFYANAPIVCVIRIGTSGGIGVKPGTVVLTDSAIDGLFNSYMELPVLGKVVKKISKFDLNMNKKLLDCKMPSDDFDVITGKTFSAIDFYEGQGRLDGSFCGFTRDDKLAFLKKLEENGVRNIEMEALCIGALAHQSNIPAVVACVTLLDRYEGDKVGPDFHQEWEVRPIKLVLRMIQKHLTAR